MHIKAKICKENNIINVPFLHLRSKESQCIYVSYAQNVNEIYSSVNEIYALYICTSTSAYILLKQCVYLVN